jgi:SAM-dependent methyltransferase
MKNLPELDKYRSRYAAQWAVTSRHFYEAGYYNWMVARIAGHTRTLEVGCGMGYSTLTLARVGHKVVSVDENPMCLKATQALLEKEGYSTKLILRGQVGPMPDGGYVMNYGSVRLDGQADVVLVEGDLLEDHELVVWLTNGEKFDSVACWLLGTHQYRGREIRLAGYPIKSPFDFRIFVQNAAYELADLVLKQHGILNVIDRGTIADDPAILNGIKEAHREQASVTSLEVGEVRFLDYAEPVDPAGIGMVEIPPDVPVDGILLDRKALTSVTSTKK